MICQPCPRSTAGSIAMLSCHITCLEIGPNRPKHANAKKKTAPGNLAKTLENHAFPHAKKKTKPENLTVIGNPQKTLEKSTFAATWKASARKRSDAPPAARPGITMPYYKIIAKIKVFACPGSWNMMHSAESLCAAWEILRLLEKPLKPLGKHGFQALSALLPKEKDSPWLLENL